VISNNRARKSDGTALYKSRMSSRLTGSERDTGPLEPSLRASGAACAPQFLVSWGDTAATRFMGHLRCLKKIA